MTTINGHELEERRNPDPPTTAEQLEYIRRCVKWTLWKIATGEDPHFHDEQELQGHAQALFQDPIWVAETVAAFAVGAGPNAGSVEYRAFLGLDQAQERRGKSVEDQSAFTSFENLGHMLSAATCGDCGAPVAEAGDRCPDCTGGQA